MKNKLLILIICVFLFILSGCYTIKIERPNSEALPFSSSSSEYKQVPNTSTKEPNTFIDNNETLITKGITISEEYKKANFTLDVAGVWLKRALDERNSTTSSSYANC